MARTWRNRTELAAWLLERLVESGVLSAPITEEIERARVTSLADDEQLNELLGG